MTKTVVAEQPQPVDELAADRLLKLEDEAAPLRSRLESIDAEVARLDAEAEPADLNKALAARRERTAKGQDLGIERSLILERLLLLDTAIAPLREDVRADELRAANDRLEVDQLAVIETALAAAQRLLGEVATFRRLHDEGRKNGLRQSTRVRNALGEVSGVLGRVNNTIRGAVR